MYVLCCTVLYCKTVLYGTVRYIPHMYRFSLPPVHIQATMKVKDLEERLKKCDADKQLIEEHLRDEMHKLRSQLDD